MKKLTLCLLILLTLSGCQKQSEKPTNRLRINFQEGDLPSLHPHDLVIYLRGLSLAKVIHEPLTRINAEGKIELAGAEAVKLSSDQLRYTFTLRNNAWSDGTPVTAQHYERAWKAALSPTSTCSRAELLYALKNGEEAKKGALPLETIGVKATDEKTLVVDLAYPNPYFLELMAQAIALPLIDPQNKNPTLFSGPFVVDEWKMGSSMRLKPNPYYWNKQNVHLEQVDISFIEDVNTVYSLYEKGELDWVGVPLCPLSSELIQQLELKDQLRSQPIGRSFWIFLNTENHPLTSPLIRQALSLAIDRAAITNHILLGGQPSLKPLSNQLLPLILPLFLKEDVSEANYLLDKGLEELGLTRGTLPPLEISYSQQSPRKQLAEYLQETWSKKLGIEVRLKGIEWNVLRTNLEKGLFCVSMAYEGAFYKDPLELLERYATHNPSNFSQWLFPAFGSKISQAKNERDTHQRMKLLGEAEVILMEQMPFIPICSDRLLFSHTPSFSGYVIDSLGALDFSYASIKRSL